MKDDEADKLARRKIAGPVHGIGLDGDDGHVRVTKMDNFRLLGGSQQTHEQMQEKAIKFNERLRRRNRRVTDLSVKQFVDLAGEVGMIGEPPRRPEGGEGGEGE